MIFSYIAFLHTLLILINLIICSSGKVALNRFIRDFELLEYDSSLIHLRAKRAINAVKSNNKLSKDNFIKIDFHAKGRKFKLRLKPETKSVFSKNLRIEGANGKKINVDLSHIVSGYLTDDPVLTKVYGSVVEGVFEGKIHAHEDTYYIEKTTKYSKDFEKLNRNHTSFHSIIYSSNDVNHQHGHEIGGGCGNEKVYQWMNEISNSAVLEPQKFEVKTSKRDKRSYDDNFFNDPFHSFPYSDNFDDIYSRSVQSRISLFLKGPEAAFQHLHPQPSSSSQPRACSLYIQTDTYLWEQIRKDVRSENQAREEIASLVAQHIKAVNHIYESADFNGFRGLKFIVQRLRINDSSACNTVDGKIQNPFCSPNIDVSNFLNLNSQIKHDDFCLAYIFTYRDFSGGTLGLAWVASTSGASGGICEKHKSYTENINGRQVQTKRSLNTGIITFVNYNSRVPPKVSELTLAHEIGHNFGSPHDFPPDCRPGGATGNYIMYSSATSGERANNNKFSPCSIRNISAVLTAVLNREGKDNCFEQDDGAFCGNKIVEEGEECDCGYNKEECIEQCCYPKEVDTTHDPNAKPCHRTFRSRCSPSEGPCCTESCQFEDSKKLCKQETECSYESLCNGRQAQCPVPEPKPNKTECNGGTQVCLKGSCVGSICQKYDMEECFLTSKSRAKPDEMCEVACQKINDVNSCKRTSEIEQMRNISGLKLRPGSPCNEFQGYCDVFQRCRAVDAEGPLARLKNLLWNHKTLLTIKQWATTYWWACMLSAIGLLLFMAMFIKCCAVHTPSSNPKKAPALKLTDTLRRPANTLRRKRTRPSHGRSHNQSSPSVGASFPLQPSAPVFSDASLSPPTHYNHAPANVSIQQTQLVVSLPPENHAVGSYSSPDPPPPYPGLNQSASLASRALPLSSPSSGPSHGYGEGRGHYNRKGQTNVQTAPKTAMLSKGYSGGELSWKRKC